MPFCKSAISCSTQLKCHFSSKFLLLSPTHTELGTSPLWHLSILCFSYQASYHIASILCWLSVSSPGTDTLSSLYPKHLKWYLTPKRLKLIKGMRKLISFIINYWIYANSLCSFAKIWRDIFCFLKSWENLFIWSSTHSFIMSEWLTPERIH